MGNLLDYARAIEDNDDEKEERRNETLPSTPQKKRKRDPEDDISTDEGIINQETPRYLLLSIVFKLSYNWF